MTFGRGCNKNHVLFFGAFAVREAVIALFLRYVLVKAA